MTPQRQCRKCHSMITSLNQEGWANWYRINGQGWYCKKCYNNWYLHTHPKLKKRVQQLALEWYYNNKERARGNNSSWCKKNKVKRAEYSRKYYLQHKMEASA